MALDHYTNERIAHSRISDHQRVAEKLRAIERAEQERRQVGPARHTPWFSRLLRPLATGHMPELDTLQRL
jgi:hypothetical protein